MVRSSLLLFFWLVFTCSLFAQENPEYRQKEVIYGRREGMALTMIVITPTGKTNNRGIIQVVSGGYVSSYGMAATYFSGLKPYLDRGYTLFVTIHSSQPKYTVPEIIPDIQRAVRFVRYYAKDYQINPDHIGITGGSSGANLSMMVATTHEKLNPSAKDPVDRVSSRVQAVACFFGATDYPNYGNSTKLNEATLAQYNLAAAFDFTKWDTTSKTFVKVADPENRRAILKQISPLYQVTPDDPPIMIAHGDADQLVPLQQSEWMIQKLKQAKVPCALRIKKGGDHGWENMEVDKQAFADWFDKYLK